MSADFHDTRALANGRKLDVYSARRGRARASAILATTARESQLRWREKRLVSDGCGVIRQAFQMSLRYELRLR